MRVFVVYWHPEPRSFNAAMFHTAYETLTAAGNDVRISDLHEMGFDLNQKRILTFTRNSLSTSVEQIK